MFGPLLEVEMWIKRRPLWREAHLEVKSAKNCQSLTAFGGCDVEKVHGIVARIDFQVDMYKTLRVWAAFGRPDAEKVHAVGARSTLGSQICQKL